jgi:hypothetical protein
MAKVQLNYLAVYESITHHITPPTPGKVQQKCCACSIKIYSTKVSQLKIGTTEAEQRFKSWAQNKGKRFKAKG